MDIKQDPNAIPNYNAGSRVGELERNEPEQAQSSVELDPADAAEPDDGRDLGARPGQVSGAGAGPDARGNGARDAVQQGRGAIDGLVGAP